jgi:Ser/Thr protein kinase RdoA (MazF antagonist)
MQIFPTQYSLLSAESLNAHISASYGLKNSTCKLLLHNVSDTYVLQDDAAKYIFKIYRDAHRKLSEIESEVELLNYLKANGAQVSYPIADLQGKQIQAFNAAEGTRYGVLFTFAEGKVVYDMSEAQLLNLGKQMAKVHLLTSAIELQHPRKEYNVNTIIHQPLQTVAPAFADLPDEYNYLLTTGQLIAAKINAIDTRQFSYGYCHYDFLPKNFHQTDTGLTFFDFDFAGKGLLANDLATLYIHYFLEVLNNKLSQQQADEQFAIFVKGYRSVKPLSDAELAAIPYLGFGFWIFFLGFVYESFEDYSNMFWGPKFLRERTALIKKWVDWYCKL